MYLVANTRPDIAYAVYQAARYTHDPRASHAVAIKRILRYIKGTKDKGIYFTPDGTEKIDCYVDSDFAGLFSVEDKQQPISAKSCTEYAILYSRVPIIWVSKMQTQIALYCRDISNEIDDGKAMVNAMASAKEKYYKCLG
jgi:hypothetical protein